ncbi:MAG: type III polyketide synthase [Nitriliruptorales bacterium]|nr:type III polyketide synthase [Nitriliruptorales bacterium]
MLPATVIGAGSAVPGEMPQEDLWTGFFAGQYRHSRLAEQVWRRSGVRTRHGVADPRVEDLSDWSTGERMRRFVAEALPLGKEALSTCLASAGLAAHDVGQLTVVSCTGYATPGLDILLARDLGMPADVQRLHIGHMGCYAAIPALATVADAVAARSKTALLLCLELTSLHIQPPTDDREQMVAHALFSDAAAAVALAPGRSGLEVLDVVARTDTDHAAMMTWDVTDLGFRMGLSSRVPKILREHVVGVMVELLGANGLVPGDVAGWAIHPGGPEIVDVVAERLGLADDQVEASRAVLREHGNCSSATILLILERLLAGGDLRAGDLAVAMAFGPGLTLYATLLRMR